MYTKQETLKIVPIPKPRMTKSDSWKQRPCVMKYWDFKDKVRTQWGDKEFPEHDFHVTFILPMAKSWPKKKKFEFDGRPHQQKPDIDNLQKALLDAIFQDDSGVWDMRTTKLWGEEGLIIINY